jgi:D-glycero-alpha-D-manno-heptose-7-phosphate kinase
VKKDLSKIVFSRAPVRICDIGGWTDTWFYPNGAVFNFCVDRYNYVMIKENFVNQIRIHSENLNLTTQLNSFEEVKYNGELDLLKAVIKRMKIKDGCDINIRSEVPPGCGTGTSASVCVTLIAALFTYLGKSFEPLDVAKIAHEIEIDELKMESGIQDQYAAALGGINFMEVSYPAVKISNIKISKSKRLELENSLILLVFGSRSSDQMHNVVIEKYMKGDMKIKNSLDTLKNCAYKMKEVINKDLVDIGDVMNQNWEAQKNLHPLMVNDKIMKAEKISKKYSAYGFKCNGAGGGGSATILANPDHIFAFKNELIEEGYKILPCKLCFNGVFSFIK